MENFKPQRIEALKAYLKSKNYDVEDYELTPNIVGLKVNVNEDLEIVMFPRGRLTEEYKLAWDEPDSQKWGMYLLSHCLEDSPDTIINITSHSWVTVEIERARERVEKAKKLQSNKEE